MAAGCNLILGNDERTLLDDPNGAASGSGGTESSGGSGASASGAAGLGGTSAAGTAGAAGANEGGGAGESGAASSVGGAGGATSSNTVGGVGAGGIGMSTTGTSSMTASSTGEPCECTPGYTDPVPMQTACGKCGTAAATRTCGEDCQWGEYGAPGACMNEGVCMPNETGQQIGHCTNGRWRDDTRTCDSECQWGAWIQGECQGDASNCTGCACVGYCTEPDTGGTTCLWIACTEAEGRAECDQDIAARCGTRKEPFEFIEWLPN